MKDSIKISSDLSSKILMIGPDCINHRGGVGAVIEVYSKYFEVFNFIPTHRTGSAIYRITIFFIGLLKLVFTLFSNRKIKIIHIHGSSYGSFYRKFIVFVICKYIFRKKTIYHIHGGSFQVFYEESNILLKRLIKTMLLNNDAVICLSHSWFEYYEKNFKIKKLIIVSNIIDYPIKTIDCAKTSLITLLYLGLISKEKGIYDLIEVIAKNKENYRNRIKLLIGGNGEEKHLKEMINSHNIEDIVEFLGWITSKEKADVLNRSDVYILPSYHEGLPISILESMSYGKAVISTTVGGIPEIVINQKNGLLINPGNLEQLEQAINTFLDHPELVKEYGANSEQMAQKHLPYSVLNELERVYKLELSNE